MAAPFVSGQKPLTADNSDFNAQSFLVTQKLSRVNTCMLVQVKAVTNSGGLSPVGFVDVQPMVNQVDGNGNATAHGKISKLPYLRLQGGSNAVIMDPVVDDIGLAAFCSRDISSVKNTRQVSNPGSRRRHSMSDGVYMGGFLNGVPVQYILFGSNGIEIISPTKVTVTAPAIELN